jgi:hypothetical protein
MRTSGIRPLPLSGRIASFNSCPHTIKRIRRISTLNVKDACFLYVEHKKKHKSVSVSKNTYSTCASVLHPRTHVRQFFHPLSPHSHRFSPRTPLHYPSPVLLGREYGAQGQVARICAAVVCVRVCVCVCARAYYAHAHL